jgi:hypothetical protein
MIMASWYSSLDRRTIPMAHSPFRLALCALVALLAPLAAAQDTTPAELRREIEQLRTENEHLAAENDELRGRNQSLEAEVASMRQEIDGLERARADADRRIADLERRLSERPTQPGGTRPAAPTAEPTPRAEIPEHHLASPASLLNAVRREYESRFPNPQLATDEDVAAYREHLTRWTREVNQSMRGQARWRVRLTDIEQLRPPRGASATMTVLDPASGLPIGDAFRVEVPSRMALKLDESESQFFDLTLMLAPTPKINAERRTRGVFEWPPFVGPMVEFAFDIEWQGLKPVASATDQPAEPEADEPAPAKP